MSASSKSDSNWFKRLYCFLGLHDWKWIGDTDPNYDRYVPHSVLGCETCSKVRRAKYD